MDEDSSKMASSKEEEEGVFIEIMPMQRVRKVLQTLKMQVVKAIVIEVIEEEAHTEVAQEELEVNVVSVANVVVEAVDLVVVARVIQTNTITKLSISPPKNNHRMRVRKKC